MKKYFKIVLLVVLTPVQLYSQIQFNWEKVYDAPYIDINNRTLTSTEVVDMVVHKGKIFAATSNWTNPNDRFNGQVIVKTSPASGWQLNEKLPGRVSRASSIISSIFRTDKNGQLLSKPDTILFIGATTHKGLNATFPGKVAWRNDAAGSWTYYDLAYSNHPMNRTEVRSMGFYRDKITNADIVFAGTTPSPLGIFAGRYDISNPDKITWDPVAEFLPVNFERILGFAECNGILYAATKSRILRRVDGVAVAQRWVELIDFRDPQYFIPLSQGLYSKYAADEDIRSFITTKPPDFTNQVLTFTTFNRLFHYNPVNNSLTEEINLKNWLQTKTGKRYNYIQSGIISNFSSGSDSYQLIGIEAIFDTAYLSSNPQPNFNGIDTRGLIISRKIISPGQINYDLIRISDSLHPNDTLTRVRTILPSPFPAENQVIYTGGFAPWAAEVENTGWIYKGTVKQNTSGSGNRPPEILIYPNPTNGLLIFKSVDNINIKCITLFTPLGKLMGKYYPADVEATIDVSSHKSGLLFALAEFDNGAFLTRKIVFVSN